MAMTYDAPTEALEPSPVLMRRIVELACLAPSIHNSQPWSWRSRGTTLELHVDRARQLRVTDPLGRNLLISCGASLHHAQAGAAALGWDTLVTRLPEGPDSPLLARIDLRPAVAPAQGDEVLRALAERCTDRRRFTSWPVPDERLQRLAAVAGAWGVQALPLLDVTERFKVDLFVARAAERQAGDEQVSQEHRDWVDRSALDGIPSTVLPPLLATSGRPDRLVVGLLDGSDHDLESSDGLIALCGTEDGPETWIRAGEGLSALWLTATLDGLSVVPLSQVVEVPQTRDALQHQVLGGLAYPLILVRIGWPPISRSQLPRTSRRPVDDVLGQS